MDRNTPSLDRGLPQLLAAGQRRRRTARAIVLVMAFVGLIVGWRVFLFQTDDAYIAFRYVSNSRLGHGYTWNLPPFRPVEGYTSFLWVFLLDGVWRLFGVAPPEAANPILLGCSAVTLGLTAYMALRLPLRGPLRSRSVLWLALVLVGVLTNRTFLAWTSSALETGMFNALVTLWVAAALFGGLEATASRFLFTLATALICLTRPDGLLYAAAASALLLLVFFGSWHVGRLRMRHLMGLTPLLLVPTHLVWRHHKYGAFVPNTYFAKHVAPWPAAGGRYLASFVLEYALWVWLVLLIAYVIQSARAARFAASSGRGIGVQLVRALGLAGSGRPSPALVRAVVVLTLVGQVAYYTLVIGGDHFEYRIYSHLVPFIFLSFLWMLDRITARPRLVLGAFVSLILLGLPTQWVHWWRSQAYTTRAQTFRFKVPIADAFPLPVRWYGALFDGLQFWMIDRSIGMRHQEHKLFQQFQTARFPSRADGARLSSSGHPVYPEWVVGVPAWALPTVNIIDRHGLSDFVIARSPARPWRQMAHDRRPPPHYVDCFRPNVEEAGGRTMLLHPAEGDRGARIVACENAWWWLARDPAAAMSGPPLFPNSDFEAGSLEGWSASGAAFATQPANGDNVRLRPSGPRMISAHQGLFWVGTHESFGGRAGEAPGQVQGDSPTGRLTSRRFRIQHSFIAFRIGGGCDPTGVSVDLLVDGKLVERTVGDCWETLQPALWYVKELVGRDAEIVIRDESSGDYGHINADDFRYLPAVPDR